MKKQLPTNKLTLESKTVRTLTEGHLRNVVGGVKGDGDDTSRPPETCSGSPEAGSAGCGGAGGGTGTTK